MGFFTSNADFDPSRQWPGTTWTQIKDMFILAAGDIYQLNATGGEATHKLTIAEMPKQKPSLYYDYGAVHHDEAKHAFQNGAYEATNRYNTMPNAVEPYGGDKPHNNMPPYVTRIYWERVG